MGYDFNQLNINSKKEINRRNRILIALLIFILFIVLYKIMLIEKTLGTKPQTFSKPATFVSGGDFTNYKKPVPKENEGGEIPAGEKQTDTKSDETFSLANFLFGKNSKAETISQLLSLNLNGTPENLILIVIDAGGSSYFSPEITPNLLELSKYGFFTEEMKVKVPSTTESHAIIFSGIYNETYDWTAYLNMVAQNTTIFDAAKSQNYSLFAIMGKGDSPEVRAKMDAALFDADNNFANLKSEFSVGKPKNSYTPASLKYYKKR